MSLTLNSLQLNKIVLLKERQFLEICLFRFCRHFTASNKDTNGFTRMCLIDTL